MSIVHKSYVVLILGLVIGHVGWIKFYVPDVYTYLIDYAQHAVILGIYWYAFRRIDLQLSERIAHNILAVVAGLFIVFGSAALNTFVSKSGLPMIGDHFPPIHGWLKAFDLTIGLCLAVLCEELVYRKLMQDVIRSYTQRPSAIYLISATIFALLHVNQGIAATINAFVAGLLLMLLYRWSKCLSVPLIAHYFADVILFGVN